MFFNLTGSLLRSVIQSLTFACKRSAEERLAIVRDTPGRWICLFRDFMFVSLTLQSECLNKAWNNLEENVSCSEKDTLCLTAYASNHTFFLFSKCVGRAISVKTQLARFPFELAVRQVKNRQTHFAKRKPFDPFWKQTPRTPFLIWLHGFSTRLWIYCKEKYQITSVNY